MGCCQPILNISGCSAFTPKAYWCCSTRYCSLQRHSQVCTVNFLYQSRVIFLQNFSFRHSMICTYLIFFTSWDNFLLSCILHIVSQSSFFGFLSSVYYRQFSVFTLLSSVFYIQSSAFCIGLQFYIFILLFSVLVFSLLSSVIYLQSSIFSL